MTEKKMEKNLLKSLKKSFEDVKAGRIKEWN